MRILAVLVLAFPPGGRAATAATTGISSNISLRKRLHVNTLITEPGTFELDVSGLYSFTNGIFTIPAALKYTPEGRHILWGRTEYSVAFDTLSLSNIGTTPLVQFSHTLTMTATVVLHDGKWLDIAIAPQTIVYRRDDAEVRLGAVAIARCDVGHNSFGGTFSWSGATRSSPTNPAGTYDAGFGFGRQLWGNGVVSRFTPHINGVVEKCTGQTQTMSAFEGVEYQATQRLAFDVSGQQVGFRGGPVDRQFVVGLTYNFGRGIRGPQHRPTYPWAL